MADLRGRKILPPPLQAEGQGATLSSSSCPFCVFSRHSWTLPSRAWGGTQHRSHSRFSSAPCVAWFFLAEPLLAPSELSVVTAHGRALRCAGEPPRYPRTLGDVRGRSMYSLRVSATINRYRTPGSRLPRHCKTTQLRVVTASRYATAAPRRATAPGARACPTRSGGTP